MILQLWNHCLQISHAHGVNPWIFAVLYVVHHPLFWGTFAILAIRYRQKRPYRSLAALAAFFWFMPYLYLVCFGRGFPWWIYVLLLLLIVLSAPHALKQIRQRLHTAD